ncbi:MAG: thymidine phosphorylase [Bdellovibrionales bacterium RIFOXYD12_FULL_39_22]|nr:MAG: thymidine phosphorylase [Bdellovibrionales bacterium RIFOXYB1_FULL_39_21]OFZ43397.1 MAG: thymidine phosphorylase [Bdellovibrionales bacterium RIFOXYC12_FULL_39_17]OFZ47423.1 MAG: thymidine phosphorylase [Bdellovibrionales bacterium RIFOXYC1_FULL_39_130]OFZ70592.1 MAG: thymidine phosphorylase [Bdellovibrionales bacterium RIFOXYC2_FULL_39_8]OFZ76303.1 MAG: thymidine phosphorylase [Bdellovibrionales bacterium RIFOXYD1_FULL_39_84]OFZ94341.1 MAG: thymidine phosphorylase [Bdellovibrionales b
MARSVDGEQNDFSPYKIIQKKRDGEELSSQEITWFIKNYTNEVIPDYQMSALLMAIYLKGMSSKETAALTDAMLYSGKVLDFKDKKVIDKHSTGGIGDKTSFILAPIAAACGVKVPMIAGRGLGHTGGTVDKIESIANFRTALPLEDFSRLLSTVGVVLIGQTADIAPADKKIYALRDVTATVESIPLITASIMSKKLAEGTSGIMMDIKVGSGAFMKTLPRARALARSIQETTLRFKKNITTMITDMSQPLGNAIGNSLEIIESIETLKGKGPRDLTDLSLQLAGGMVYLAGLAKSHKEGVKKAQTALTSGAALSKFKEMIAAQGGDSSVVDDYKKFPVAKCITKVEARTDGYVAAIDGVELGLHCVDLGAGRKQASDKVDYSTGIIIAKKLGERVKKGDLLAEIYHHQEQQMVVKKIKKAILTTTFKFSKNHSKKAAKLIIEVQTKWSKK